MKKILTLLTIAISFDAYSQTLNMSERTSLNINNVDSVVIGDNVVIKKGATINDDIDYSSEPPLIFKLKIDNSEVILSENQEYLISGDLDKNVVSIKSLDFKIFQHENIEFSYPKQFYFTPDLNNTSKTWTLVGDDFTIFYIYRNEPIDLDEMLKGMTESYEEKGFEFKISSIKRRFNNIELVGRSVDLEVSGNGFKQELFTFNNGKNKQFFVFSDFLNTRGAPSKEAEIALRLFNKSLKQK